MFLEGPAELLTPLFREAGGHRYMRVPPTERKGRVHTSTVTVAVFEGHLEPQQNTAIPSKDILERVTKGTGPGGQNRNKRETAIVLRHIPTGIEVKAEAERTQEGNRRVAMATLQVRVAEHLARTAKQQVDHQRKSMLGGGARGDKVRTYRADGVTDHRTGQRAQLTSIEAGKLELLQ
ncbi:peptide chain release factor-like protein [Burkholderia ubonensis]|nr:peptide chain release factor-like protein [Burkholderia ubonensis]